MDDQTPQHTDLLLPDHLTAAVAEVAATHGQGFEETLHTLILEGLDGYRKAERNGQGKAATLIQRVKEFFTANERIEDPAPQPNSPATDGNTGSAQTGEGDGGAAPVSPSAFTVGQPVKSADGFAGKVSEILDSGHCMVTDSTGKLTRQFAPDQLTAA